MSSGRRTRTRVAGLLTGLAVGLVAFNLSRLLPPDGEGGGPGAGEGPPSGFPGEAEGSSARPVFVDASAASGIRFVHENGHSGQFHYPEIMGAGIGLLDFDGDGYLDVYLVNGNHLTRHVSSEITNRLYRNNGDWTFSDVTPAAGVGDPGFGQGCCAADYDNDGDVDLYVSNFGPNVLYRNDGDGTFTDVTKTAGVTDPLWGQTCSFLDYDGDGWLDLYVQNYLTYSMDRNVEAYIYVGDEKLRDYPSPAGYSGAPDHLYRNDGDGTFTDVTEQAGLLRPDGKGMGLACLDFDDDGHVDILVTNDGTENFLFRGRGDGTFEEVGLSAGIAYDGVGIPESSMGVDVGDYDADGRLDLIIPCTRRQVYTLYRNRGDYFSDASMAARLAQSTSSRTGFNANFLDYDDDGDLDLFFTTGGVRANQLVGKDASYIERYGIPDLLLSNTGDGSYTDVSAVAGDHFARALIGRGSATGDLDNDGDVDLVISNLAGEVVVLRNETRGGNWLLVELRPRKGNRDAIGADLRLTVGGTVRRHVVHGAVTYLSQIDRRPRFGLGGATEVERLEVRWPSGTVQTFQDLAVNRILRITEGEDAPGAAGAVGAPGVEGSPPKGGE